MKEKLRKFGSMAIIGLLVFSGCLDFGSDEAIGDNLNPTVEVKVISVKPLLIWVLRYSLRQRLKMRMEVSNHTVGILVMVVQEPIP